MRVGNVLFVTARHATVLLQGAWWRTAIVIDGGAGPREREHVLRAPVRAGAAVCRVEDWQDLLLALAVAEHRQTVLLTSGLDYLCDVFLDLGIRPSAVLDDATPLVCLLPAVDGGTASVLSRQARRDIRDLVTGGRRGRAAVVLPPAGKGGGRR